MRLMSEKTKLVFVDEPTSAMDPTGERDLFETLRRMRAGKTMVFVTHRFGHLTRHADLILCVLILCSFFLLFYWCHGLTRVGAGAWKTGSSWRVARTRR